MRLIRVLASALVALLILTVVPGSAAAAPPAKRYANAAHQTTNVERDKRDLRTLRKNACLTRFAVRQAKRMAAKRQIFHQNLRPVLKRCGMRRVGENVAFGFRTGRSVVRDGWMNSQGHRANILERRYRLMGIGARKAGGAWYVAQVFGTK